MFILKWLQEKPASSFEWKERRRRKCLSLTSEIRTIDLIFNYKSVEVSLLVRYI